MARAHAALLVASVIASVAIASAPDARADATSASLFRLRSGYEADTSHASTRTWWTGSSYTLTVDPTLRARWIYDALASLPVTESKVNTYDIHPIIAAVTYQTLNLSNVQLTFITSRSLMVADLGKGASLSLDPKSIRSGAVSFSMLF